MAQYFFRGYIFKENGTIMNNWKVRLVGLLLVAATIWYLPWVFANLNWHAFWLAIPFALASLMTALMTIITIRNHWRYSRPEEHPAPAGQEPRVAVIIPTYGEPVSMVYATAQSVLEQDYPQDKIVLVISDDAHRDEIRAVVRRLKKEYPRAIVGYNDPPRKGDARRRGDAKAGNLNSIFEMLNREATYVPFIETRDADDKVGDKGFLRQAIGQFLTDPKIGFVQTYKDAAVSCGDPFGNLEPLFYRKAMLARNAANAVFPCGSGVVYRREALDEIGGFPIWNLVEDLQSGIEILRRGWRGVYLPVVGAVGQIAPEDIPNVIKQRGTWALDTMRITIWGNKHGLTLGQHLQFSELGFFYLLSFAVLTFAVTPVFSLAFHIYPLVTTQAEYAVHFWPYAALVELFLITLADGLPYEDLWRSRQMWLGMAPVYAIASLIALLFGPNRKPTYRVTRKEHVYGWYWREIWPQLALFWALVGASLYHLATHSLLATADLGSLFWALFFILGLSQIVRNSWYGIGLRQAIREALKRPVRRPVPARVPVRGNRTE
jgi:cellulose synthase (UDP-forming)